MASSTGEGSAEPDAQAEPCDTDTPAASSCSTRWLARRPGKATLKVFGSAPRSELIELSIDRPHSGHDWFLSNPRSV